MPVPYGGRGIISRQNLTTSATDENKNKINKTADAAPAALISYCTYAVLRVLSLSLRFNSHFPGEPGLASVY